MEGITKALSAVALYKQTCFAKTLIVLTDLTSSALPS